MRLAARISRFYLETHSGDAARSLEELSSDQAAAALGTAPPGAAAGALALMAPALGAACLRCCPEEDTREILEAMQDDAAARILWRLDVADRERFLGDADPKRARRLRRLLEHPEGSAGALMDPAAETWAEDLDAAEAHRRLRRGPQRLRYYLYVTDREQRLVGVLTLRELLTASPGGRLASLMHRPVAHLDVRDGRRTILSHPGWRSYHALPVTEPSGALAGVLTYETMRRVEETTAAEQSPDLISLGASLGEAWIKIAATMLAGVAGGLRAARDMEASEAKRVSGEGNDAH